MIRLDLETDNTSRRQVGEVSAAEAGPVSDAVNWRMRKTHQDSRGFWGRAAWTGVLWKGGRFATSGEDVCQSLFRIRPTARVLSCLSTIEAGPPHLSSSITWLPLFSGTAGRGPSVSDFDMAKHKSTASWPTVPRAGILLALHMLSNTWQNSELPIWQIVSTAWASTTILIQVLDLLGCVWGFTTAVFWVQPRTAQGRQFLPTRLSTAIIPQSCYYLL